MVWYELRIYERIRGGPMRLLDTLAFEARDNAGAIDEATRRVSKLQHGRVGVLSGPDGQQIWNRDSPDL